MSWRTWGLQDVSFTCPNKPFTFSLPPLTYLLRVFLLHSIDCQQRGATRVARFTFAMNQATEMLLLRMQLHGIDSLLQDIAAKALEYTRASLQRRRDEIQEQLKAMFEAIETDDMEHPARGDNHPKAKLSIAQYLFGGFVVSMSWYLGHLGNKLRLLAGALAWFTFPQTDEGK